MARRKRVNYISTRGPKLEKRNIDTADTRAEKILRDGRSDGGGGGCGGIPLIFPRMLMLVKRKGSIPRAGNSWRIMSTVARTTVYYGVARAIKNAFCIMQDNQAGQVWDRWCWRGALPCRAEGSSTIILPRESRRVN